MAGNARLSSWSLIAPLFAGCLVFYLDTDNLLWLVATICAGVGTVVICGIALLPRQYQRWYSKLASGFVVAEHFDEPLISHERSPTNVHSIRSALYRKELHGTAIYGTISSTFTPQIHSSRPSNRSHGQDAAALSDDCSSRELRFAINTMKKMNLLETNSESAS